MSSSVNQKLYALLENHVSTPEREQRIQACIDEGLDLTDPELTYQVVTQDKISNCCFKYLLAAPEACFHTQTRTGRNRGETAIHALCRFKYKISYLRDVLNRYDCWFETISKCLSILPAVLYPLIGSYLDLRSKKDALKVRADGYGETPLFEALFNRNFPAIELLAPHTDLNLPYFPPLFLGQQLAIARSSKTNVLWAYDRQEELRVEWERNPETEFTPVKWVKISAQVLKELYEKFSFVGEASTCWILRGCSK